MSFYKFVSQNFTCMKNLFFVVCMLSSMTVFSQQWSKLYIPHGRNIVDVQVRSLTDIQAIGGSLWNDSIESIFRSTNAGLDWDYIRDYPGSSWVESFAYRDSLNGVAVGTNGKIMKTANGGITWAYFPSPINSDFKKIVFLTGNKAVVVGGREADSTHSVMITTNGGQTWSVVFNQAGGKLNSVHFTDTLTGVAVGYKGTILKTTDGGFTWNPVSSPVQWDLNSVTFLNSDTGYAVGGRQYNTSVRTILKTTNGGSSWSVVKDEPGAWLNSITFIDAATGFIVGDSATMLKTTDGGATWYSNPIPNTFLFEQFNVVKFFSPDFGVVGCYGTVYIYNNAPVPVVNTLGVNNVNDSVANFFGEVDMQGFPGNYRFIYATAPDFSNAYGDMYPPQIVNNAMSIVTQQKNGLTPGATYYYYLEANTIAGRTNGDTLSFVCQNPNYTFQTNWINSPTNTSVTLQGIVANLQAPTNLYFDYGTSNALSNTVVASPAIVNDGSTYNVTANLTGLSPYVPYYFRMRGVSGTNIYMGNTTSFVLGAMFDSLVTKPATNVNTTTATLNAFVSKLRFPCTVWFEYGTTPSLGTVVAASPASVTDTLDYTCMATIAGLQPYNTYYYRVKVVMPGFGEFYGLTEVFNSGNLFAKIQTMPATAVSYASGQVNGFVQGAIASTSLSFEYGTTNSLGSQAAATPAVINDQQPHNISAILTGLSMNTVYYYRLKAVAAGVTVYGETRQFYTANAGVPNWDFEIWQHDTVELPVGWNMMGRNFAKVPGITGHGLKLLNNNVTILGVLGDSFIGGQAFTSRPDSFVAYLNYYIEPGDSAMAAVWLFKSDTPVVLNFYKFGGTSGGVYKRMAFPVDYSSALTPDSLAVGFVSTTPDNMNVPHPNNYVAIDDVGFIPSSTPVYNGNFETWKNVAIEQPVGWGGGPILFADTFNFSELPVKKVVHIAPDDYAVEIKTILYNGNYLNVDLSNADKMFGGNEHGSPILIRHQSFNGYYRYYPAQGDTCEISLSMYKQGQDVGNASLRLTDTISSFVPFDIPISYNSSSVVPDSVVIFFRSTVGRVTGISRLAVDKLNFDGFLATGIEENTITPNDVLSGWSVYPNPANNRFTVERLNPAHDKTDIILTDLNGQILLREVLQSNQAEVQLNVSDLPQGLYLLRITGGGHTATRKVVLAK